MEILHLTLKKKWFDMILSGEKTEEYREIKDYWIKRLGGGEGCGIPYKHYDIVIFKNGYSSKAPTMSIECKGIEIKIGESMWGAPKYKVFTIKLGKIIKTSNLAE